MRQLLTPMLPLILMSMTHTAVPAQDRPSDAEIFGSASPSEPAASSQPTSSAATPTVTEGQKSMEPKDSTSDLFASGEVADNALQIGGTLYQRLLTSSQEDVKSSEYPLSMPLQFDLFLDARPSDRVRGFVDQRVLYDSSKDSYSRPTAGKTAASLAPASTAPNNPQTVLDQAWIKFDIERKVFVTIGKQHLKWGTSKYWNPTDFLSSQRRDPLVPYDLRLGESMAKFELPIESKKTNLYAVGLFNNPEPASTLGQLGLALRAESVFGETEIGLDLVSRGNRTPSYGADVSSSLGPLDVYAEAALLTSAVDPKYTLTGAPLTAGADVTTLYTSNVSSDSFVQTSGGASYSFAWTENRVASIGVEYFHNPLGYDGPGVYPLLLFFNQYQPFYLGRDYAALYVTAEGPDAQKNTSYTFSTLSNLSDKSFMSRLDFRWRTLTYLTFESFFAVHYGHEGSEFNLKIDTPQLTYGTTSIAAVKVPRTVCDLGLGLRLAF